MRNIIVIMAILKVHTAQNVDIDYELGNAGERLVAAVIDLVVVILYIIGVVYLFDNVLNVTIIDQGVNLLAFFLIMLPTLFYLPVSEYFWHGRTVGKKIMKLKVVRENGTAPSLGDYILRWLLRTIDVKLGFLLIFFVPRIPSSEEQAVFLGFVIFFSIVPLPVVGLLAMAKTRHSQRVGDIVAGTVVIKNKPRYSLDDTILQSTEEEYEPVYKNVLVLSDRDINIIKNALRKAEKTRNYEYIVKLADKASEILQVESQQKPLQFLQTLMRDYDHLAKKQDAHLKL